MEVKKKKSNTCKYNEYCRYKFKDINEIPDSNELLNAFLIILGGIYVFQAIVQWFGPFLPDYITGVIEWPGISDILQILAPLGTYQLIIGVGALISGIGLNAEQEWAWGMGLIVLVFIATTSIMGIISIFSGGGLWLSLTFFLEIVCIIASVLGIFWLLGTKERYY
ncbi:MAG: hypothetical protein ACTSPQ_15515 [Candidatus Helarchaeota archaeon]